MVFAGLPLFGVAIVLAVLAVHRPVGVKRTRGMFRAAVWGLLGVALIIAAIAATAGFLVGLAALACFGALAVWAARVP